MKYIALRIAHNDSHWETPSKGRLNQTNDYVGENGFGHEDWNFNIELSQNGAVFGYQRYEPREELQNERFNICFLDYDGLRQQWYIVGFYLKASYDQKGAEFSNEIIQKKRNDLMNLGDSLSRKYAKKINKNLKADSASYHWKVSVENIVKLVSLVPYPKFSKSINSFHYTTSLLDLERDQFYNLLEYAINASAEKEIIDYDDIFPEGKILFEKHKSRERNKKLIERKKAIFKKQHNGKLFCEVCGMCFEDIYGDYGKNFIEAHHIIPVSSMTDESTTRLDDLVLLCSNCHRMIHHRRPWLKKNELKNLIRQK
ncbi:MAG: HNH endonuclease [Fibrobacteraceae bacterium]|nr:HNH endonuclease [Fibrobacteraceae bacterium]